MQPNVIWLYQRFTILGCRDKGIRILESVISLFVIYARFNRIFLLINGQFFYIWGWSKGLKLLKFEIFFLILFYYYLTKKDIGHYSCTGVHFCIDYFASQNVNMNGSAQLGSGKPGDLSRFSLQYNTVHLEEITQKTINTPQFCTKLLNTKLCSLSNTLKYRTFHE